MFAENVSRHNPAELQAKCQSLTLPAASWINIGYCPRPHFKPRINCLRLMCLVTAQLNCTSSVSPGHCRQPAGSIMAIARALMLSHASISGNVSYHHPPEPQGKCQYLIITVLAVSRINSGYWPCPDFKLLMMYTVL